MKDKIQDGVVKSAEHGDGLQIAIVGTGSGAFAAAIKAVENGEIGRASCRERV